MNILMTGGSGMLGSEIRDLDRTIVAPSQEELDITDISSVINGIKKYVPDVVLHLAAAVRPHEHEKNPEWGVSVNIIGTANIATVCIRRNIKLVYVSTDYLYVGGGPHREEEALRGTYNYGWSKLGGEAAVHTVPRHLILRLSFGPAPFPFENVYIGQWTSKLYVDEMAPLVLAAARSKAEGVMNVGGPRTTLEDYARRTRSDVQTIPRPEWVPADTSLDISKMKVELGIVDEHSLWKH